MTGEEEKEGLGAADESGVKTPAKPAAKKVAKAEGGGGDKDDDD